MAPDPQQLQEHFENLEILELLGQGGMGAVYKARQRSLDRLVALKILSPQLTNDPSFAQRFTREARTLARLTHPNIVMVFEFGTVGQLHYLVMEYVDGVDLRNGMRNKSLEPDQALRVVQQVCSALQYAHDEGVVHRDIKPENILLGLRGEVKIADFGLAKLIRNETLEHSLTGTRQVLGTRNYMAPEQIEKPEHVDHRADIYSLGVVFYELLTGELPLGRFAVPSEKAEVNTQLDDVVLRALEKEPARRYQQASQVQTAVESISEVPRPAESPAAARPPVSGKFQRLPFTITNLYGGLAVAHGIAHFDGEVVELEFEVRDDVCGALRSRTQRVRIPASEILMADFRPGAFSGKLRVTTTRLDTGDQVPGNTQGQFLLKIKREHRPLAEAFAGALDQAILANPGAGAPRTVPPHQRASAGARQFAGVPAKESPVSPLPEQEPEAERLLRGPAIGLLITGALNGLVALGLAISFMTGMLDQVQAFAELPTGIADGDSAGEGSPATVVAEPPPSPAEHTAAAVAVSWPKQLMLLFRGFALMSFVVSLAMAVLLVYAGLRMMVLRDYQFCMLASVLALIPFHGASLPGIAFGIWALVVLNRPGIRETFSSSVEYSPASGSPAAKPARQNHAALADAFREPFQIWLRIFITVLIVLVCCLFTYGIVSTIIKFAANRFSGPVDIRPEFVLAASDISKRMDGYDREFRERIEKAVDIDDPQEAIRKIENDMQLQTSSIREEIRMLGKQIQSTNESRRARALENRLEEQTTALRNQLQRISGKSNDP